MECLALAVLSLAVAVFRDAVPLAAQGVTGAAIEGRVVSVDSTPLEQAIVQVTNTSNGERWHTTTSARGSYFLEYLSVGVGGAGNFIPLLWTPEHGMRRLPTLAGGAGFPRHMNEFGQIVGFSANEELTLRAAVWTPVAGPVAVAGSR